MKSRFTSGACAGPHRRSTYRRRQSLYQGCSTGASEFSVDDIVLELNSATTTGSIDVAVYSDNSGAPGALFDHVYTLPGTAVHSSPFATDVPAG